MEQKKSLIILGIDTSCDDTCIAILKVKNFDILSNIVSSQVKLHKKYGGVWPYLAKREHQKNLPIVFKEALQQARSKQKFEKPNLIAVTVGPGLEPCLWTGVNFAKELAQKLNLPIIPVNHIEAHILSNFVNKKLQTINYKIKTNLFPALCLVVSGGHTQLILMKKVGKYKIIGETRDDAAGECFDKTARILGLGYPGGPAIEAEAAKLKTKNYQLITNLPRPMIRQKNYDFSFSGLKTAVLYDFKNKPRNVRTSKKYKIEMAKEIQQAVIDVLIKKTIKAAKDFNARSIILGGGVTANQELRKQFNYKLKTINYKLNLLVPSKNLCTDNASMVTMSGYFNRKKATTFENISVNANLKI